MDKIEISKSEYIRLKGLVNEPMNDDSSTKVFIYLNRDEEENDIMMDEIRSKGILLSETAVGELSKLGYEVKIEVEIDLMTGKTIGAEIIGDV
jgi:hypothetical protein